MDADSANGDGKELLEQYRPGYGAEPFANEAGLDLVMNTAGSPIPEAVPRYSKREGEFIIQGSNNTLISLGTSIEPLDEGTDEKEAFESEDGEGSNLGSYSMSGGSEHTGAIDIVVGRGSGFETLIGWLFLKDPQRLSTLFEYLER